jgi:LmbE family N-acetylglucosaminyl deacetylase
MKSAASIFAVIILTCGSLFINTGLPAKAQSSIKADQQNTSEERGMVALDQALRDLGNPFTVMAVVARPEDADYATLAHQRKRLGARTVIVFATRGESGESIAFPPGTNIGVINTGRALEAAQIIGADVYFLNLADLSYIKSADKVLAEWGHDTALGNMVRAVRLLRPDVIITSNGRDSNDGQGQAVARLALESIDAAADPERFKAADTEVWNVTRLFQSSELGDAQATLSVDEFDQARGLSYQQIGARASEIVSSNSQSKSANRKQYYKLIKPASDATLSGRGLLDGMLLPEKLRRPLTVPFVGDVPAIDAITQRERLIASLRDRLIEKRAEGTVEQIRERYGNQFFRMIRYIEALERALGLAYGLSFFIEIRDSVLVPSQRLEYKLVINNGSDQRLSVVFHTPESLSLSGSQGPYKSSEALDLFPNDSASIESSYNLPKDAPLTLPRATHLYDERYFPAGSALPGARAGGVFGHRFVTLAQVLLPDTNILLPAQIRFDVAQPIEIETVPFVLLKNWDTPREIEIPVRLRNRLQSQFAGALWVVSLALNRDDYEPAHIVFSREDEEIEVRLKLTIPVIKPPLATDILLEFRRERPSPPDPLASMKIAVKTLDFDVAAGLKIGLVGNDSRISQALVQLGVEHEAVAINPVKSLMHTGVAADNQSSMICGDLRKYDSIVVVEDSLPLYSNSAGLRDCLLEYVRLGGNLVVLRQPVDRWDSAIAPAPFEIKLSGGLISASDSYAKISDENHPLMAKPNRLTPISFNGWKQVIASSLPVEWSPEYTSVIEFAGTGEEAQKGALLVARTGEGSYIYSSFEFGRQLSEVNPGAYRLLANLISYGKVIKESNR